MMVGDRIRMLRKENGFSQKELSEALGVSASAVGMYEQNRRVPELDTLKKLCDLLGTTADWLLFGRTGKPGEDGNDT